MSDRIRVFVNERVVSVPSGAPASAAVTALDPALGEAVAAGRAYLTDGRGIRCDPSVPTLPGAIFRVIVSARRDADDADAHA